MKRSVLPGLIVLMSLFVVSCSPEVKETTTGDLAGMFSQPPLKYGPYVWWHWMGPNFSKDGIRKDLEAMKESGIAGATIFNLTSAVQESEGPIENNPWPDQAYRSTKYWEALEYAAGVAEELGLKIGLHNCPGYSTTGGPWITEEQGMRTVVMSDTKVIGGRKVSVSLPVPDLPSFSFYTGFTVKATKFHDIAVIAVQVGKNADSEEVLDISGNMDASGKLEWDAPSGDWMVYRIGHACTMGFPHPVPEDLLGKCLEADKMNAEISAYHWDNVLGPLKEHLGQYFGKSFTHLLVDSYEAGGQNWTEGFREAFVSEFGYDPVPMYALKDLFLDREDVKMFEEDNNALISKLFIDNGFKVARDKIHEVGLQLFWEPYVGPFDTAEAVPVADLPMGEFCSHTFGHVRDAIVDKAKEAGINIVGAEAFTGVPEYSRYTEDPAFLKRSADGAFLSGANLMFLHHWVHQPFDDRYQPGMGMGWWGTHFGRNQTWFEPGKEFFRYLTRCQMMLRQGVLEERDHDWIHRKTGDSDIYFAANQGDKPLTIGLAPWDGSCRPEYWDPYSGKISFAEGLDGTAPDSLRVTLEPGKSMFVVLNHGKSRYDKAPVYVAKSSVTRPVEDVWDLDLAPKLGEPFSVKSFKLKDFSQCDDERLRYFSGTATYSSTVKIGKEDLTDDKRVVLDLGELNDISELYLNGKKAATLWYPPYRMDVTDYLKEGENLVSVVVTNNWANALIGDERFEPDFEWGTDRGENYGRAMKAFPDWFLKGEPRPSPRKTFVIWSYYRKDSPLQPAGLVGPVNIEIQSL